MKNMKKVLSALGLLAVGAPVSLSVVACGSDDGKSTLPSWDLNAYNNDDRTHSIWVDQSTLKKDLVDTAGETYSEKAQNFLAWKLWTGMFDADDADKDHSRQLKRFNDQEVGKHLIINNSASLLVQMIVKSTLPEEERNFEFKNVELSLDNDLKSKTDQQNPKDYILKASKTTLKSISVIFINEKERTEALSILSETIDKAKKVEVTDWSLKDQGDLLFEMILGITTFDNKDVTIEKIKTVTSQLAWQINKFVDKYDTKASELKQNLSYHLAWATEMYNKAIEVSDIKGKNEFLSIIDKAIAIYNNADETKFDEMKDELFQATDKFINENNLTFEAITN